MTMIHNSNTFNTNNIYHNSNTFTIRAMGAYNIVNQHERN